MSLYPTTALHTRQHRTSPQSSDDRDAQTHRHTDTHTHTHSCHTADTYNRTDQQLLRHRRRHHRHDLHEVVLQFTGRQPPHEVQRRFQSGHPFLLKLGKFTSMHQEQIYRNLQKSLGVQKTLTFAAAVLRFRTPPMLVSGVQRAAAPHGWPSGTRLLGFVPSVGPPMLQPRRHVDFVALSSRVCVCVCVCVLAAWRCRRHGGV